MRFISRLGLCAVLTSACSGDIGSSDVVGQSSDAVFASNGVQFNGVQFNGVQFNGVQFNGVQFNGVQFNGVQFNGTSMQGTMNGSQVSGTGFIGAQLIANTSAGNVTIRIDNIVRDTDPDIYLYWLSGYDTGHKKWAPLCLDSHGKSSPAIPVLGRWGSDGSKDSTAGYFTFGCRGQGAIAKCVDLGYKPWKACTSGNCVAPTLDLYHQACVRMIRADYCGTGVSYTANGHALDVLDGVGIQWDDHYSYPQYAWYFEGEWTPQGVACLMSDPNLWRTVAPPCAATLPRCPEAVDSYGTVYDPNIDWTRMYVADFVDLN